MTRSSPPVGTYLKRARFDCFDKDTGIARSGHVAETVMTVVKDATIPFCVTATAAGA